MNKKDFLAALDRSLTGLPTEDREKSLSFYEEMISDRMEEGETEEEAMAAIGTVEEITAQVLADIPLTRLVRAKVRPGRALKVWEIVLLILGCPLWLPLLLAGAALLLSVYLLLWAVVLTLYTGDLTLVLGGIAFTGGAFLYTGHIPTLLTFLGTGLACMGLGIFCFFGLNQITKYILVFSRKELLWLKSLFIRKEEAK